MAAVMRGIGIPEPLVERELAETDQVRIADTAGNKSMLATLNDLAGNTQHRWRSVREPDLVATSVSQCHTPMAPLGFRFAADIARELFGLEPFRRGMRSSF
jgi:hypothetical protein